MADDTEPTALRRLSKIELFAASRHHLGIYRCVAVTCRYHLPASSPSLSQDALFAALATVVASQPMLRVGILNQHTGAASFSHVPRLDLRDHVDFRPAFAGAVADYESHVADIQAGLHDQLWSRVETRPPWTVVVVAPEEGLFSRPAVDVVFAFHHALCDGASGKTFHEALLAALNQPAQPPASASSQPAYRLSFPEPPALPEGQDDAIPFTSSISFIAGVLWSELAPSWLKPTPSYPWAGGDISFALPYRTAILPVDIPPPTLAAVLAACRTHNTSLTALLHALVLASLSTRLPPDQASSFTSSTPISLRPYLAPSTDPALRDAMRDLVSGTSHAHPAAEVSALRGSPDRDALIWRAAARVKTDIAARAASLPADDPASLLRFVGDWPAFWRAKDGRPRETSWEVSNIGVVRGDACPPNTTDPSTDPSGEDGFRIARALFSNGAMVAGPALGVSVASVRGAGLTAGISWQRGVVDEALARGVAADLGAWTARLAERGRFVG